MWGDGGVPSKAVWAEATAGLGAAERSVRIVSRNGPTAPRLSEETRETETG